MEINLKEYTRKAKELESIVYTQKKLMEEHERVIDLQYPEEPKRVRMAEPDKPFEPYEEADSPLGVIAALFGTGFSVFLMMNVPMFGIVMFIACFAGLCMMYSSYKKSKKRAQMLDYEYRDKMEEYNKALVEHKKQDKILEADYLAALANYKFQITQFEVKKDEIVQKHNKILKELEKALYQFYSQNIIFPKYRNLVAIATINEYLESGRCSTLEGADGAYNLYEMEMRQNIVIGQLSSIISNLEQIRNNQYSLYQELTKANQTVNEIVYELQNLNSTERLNAYFNYVTAVAAVSPKVYHGVSF